MSGVKRLPLPALGLAGLFFLLSTVVSKSSPPAVPAQLPPARHQYVPLVMAPFRCPSSSGNSYSAGSAYQYDEDNPVRPAHLHADKNIALRGYVPSTYPGLKRSLVDYGLDDKRAQPPQFTTLFSPPAVPEFTNYYSVRSWKWVDSSVGPGTPGAPETSYPVTALGLRTYPGQPLHVPSSGYDIGQGMEVLVIYADEDTVALRYTREDSSGSPGYTVHVDNICTDPNLLALYNRLDGGDRYVYRYRGYCCYNLPALPAGQQIGVARGEETVVAIVDSGAFMDPRSCEEWWQGWRASGRPCPPHE